MFLIFWASWVDVKQDVLLLKRQVMQGREKTESLERWSSTNLSAFCSVLMLAYRSCRGKPIQWISHPHENIECFTILIRALYPLWPKCT